MAQERALHQDLFTLLAVVGIAVGGFMIGISVFVSSAGSTVVIVPDVGPPIDIPPDVQPPDEEDPPVVEPPNGEEPPVIEDPPLPPAQGDHPAAEELRARVDNFYLALGAKDVPRMLTFYSNDNPFAEWSGQSGVFAGSYPGFSNVRLLWASVIGNTETIEASVSNYAVNFIGDTATVTYKLVTTGNGKLVGDFDMEIDVLTVWEYVDGQWIISDDRWDFVLFEVEIVAQGTVFPLHWQKRGDFSIWDDRIARLFNP